MKNVNASITIFTLLLSGVSLAQSEKYGVGALPSGTGAYNAAFGYYSMNGTTTGRDNTGIGTGALYLNKTGSFNTATGSFALFESTANNNTAVGYESMRFNTTGADNIATGYQSLHDNKTGSRNSATGFKALYFNNAWDNVANGFQSLMNNTTGIRNVAIGSESLERNTGGSYNTALGFASLFHNVGGSGKGNSNTATGYHASYNNRDGSYNTSSGMRALFENVTGNFNTGIGYYSLANVSTGSFNVGVGWSTGARNSSNSVYVGANAQSTAPGNVAVTNEIVIGYYARGLGSNTASIGNNNIVKTILHGNVGIGTDLVDNSAFNYKLAVKGTIGAWEIRCENTSATWADYVFEKDYDLMPLDELENYLTTEKHLPEVPSAKEVEDANGFYLGEMQVTLLKKIEELTLYTIEQQKQLRAQSEQIEKLIIITAKDLK